MTFYKSQTFLKYICHVKYDWKTEPIKKLIATTCWVIKKKIFFILSRTDVRISFATNTITNSLRYRRKKKITIHVDTSITLNHSSCLCRNKKYNVILSRTKRDGFSNRIRRIYETKCCTLPTVEQKRETFASTLWFPVYERRFTVVIEIQWVR